MNIEQFSDSFCACILMPAFMESIIHLGILFIAAGTLAVKELRKY